MSARWSRPISIRRLNKPEDNTIEATLEERDALANALDVLSIDSLTASISLRPFRSHGVRVEGVVRGKLTQACGVTLEPVPGTVEETFNVRLDPDVPEDAAVDVDPESEDPPERLEGDVVDVGAIALEHFVLGIDPYPRAPGAEFEAETDGEDEPSPFAVLKVLKQAPN